MTPLISLKGCSGIYQIVNLINGKVYVGKTKCMWRRCHGYLTNIRKTNRNKINSRFMNAILKYGVDCFVFLPLELCDLDLLAERELYWIDRMQSTNDDKGYNLRRDSSTGMITHSSTREKISKNLKQQWADGVRDDHSYKMKKSWENNLERRIAQSNRMSETKTKYVYIINNSEPVTYGELCDLGFRSALSNFHRKKSDVVLCKGSRITRIRKEP